MWLINSLSAPIYFRHDSDCQTKNTSATTKWIRWGNVNDVAEIHYFLAICIDKQWLQIFICCTLLWKTCFPRVMLCSLGSRLSSNVNLIQRSLNGFSLLVNNNVFDQTPRGPFPYQCHHQPVWLWMSVKPLILFSLFIAHQSAPPTACDSIASKIWFHISMYPRLSMDKAPCIERVSDYFQSANRLWHQPQIHTDTDWTVYLH